MKVVKREEVTPSRTCKQHKTSNLDNLPKKTIKQSTKSLEKIRQAGKYKYNAKMQKSKQKKQHTIVQCGCDHTVQMQNENKQKKNCNTLLPIMQSKQSLSTPYKNQLEGKGEQKNKRKKAAQTKRKKTRNPRIQGLNNRPTATREKKLPKPQIF